MLQGDLCLRSSHVDDVDEPRVLRTRRVLRLAVYHYYSPILYISCTRLCWFAGSAMVALQRTGWSNATLESDIDSPVIRWIR